MTTPRHAEATIFLSYARNDDEPFVKRLHQDLTAAGFDVWFDRASMPSRALTFLQEIRDAISARDRLVLVVGPSALTSDYVEAEWRWALDFGKPVNPVLRLGEYDTLPDELKLLDAPDFRDDAHYEERLETLVRQLSEPVPPMGKLVGVPSLPQHLLKRADRLRALKDAVLADVRRTAVVTGEPARVGVHGMGGIGKSVLATMLARDTEVRRAFPDGVIWVPIGQTPNLAELQRAIAKALGDLGIFDNVGEGKAKLQELLADRAVLLLLDDLWDGNHAEAFDCLGPRCRMVITSRDAGTITALGGTEHQVQLLTEAEARDLLAEWAGLVVAALPAQAAAAMAHCGRLPLALSLCGAMVRDGESWDDLLEALAEADLEYLDHPHGSILRSITVSVDRLAPDEAARFAELRVFPPDATTPEAAVATLWAHTGGLSDRHARKLLTGLETKALIRLDGVSPNRQVSLHDLVYDYAGGMIADEAALHGQLLEAYRKLCPYGWASGPNDGYFLQRLVHHLIEAGQHEELLPLLTDYRFLDTKLRGVSVQSLVEDYERAEVAGVRQDEVVQALRLIGGALRLSAHVLAQDANQLPSQLFGRLVGLEGAGVQAIRADAEQVVQQPWLRPLTPSLDQAGEALLRTFTGHANGVTAVAVTADQRRVVSASYDQALKVWDLETGSELRTLTGHTKEVNAVAVTPDGRRAISASDDQSLKLWDLETGSELRTLIGHTEEVNAVAVTPDGRRAVSASDDQTLKVWDLESGMELCNLVGHSSPVEAVAVVPDGRWAVSASGDETLKVWDLESGAEVRTISGHSSLVSAVAVTPDGRRIISASYDETLRVWDLHTGIQLRTLTGHTSFVTAIAVTVDGRRMVSASYDQTLKVWDLETGSELQTLRGHSWMLTSVAVTADGRRAISASEDQTLKMWDLASGTQSRTLSGHGRWVTAVAVTVDGRRAISASEDQTLRVWDLESGSELYTLAGHSGPVGAVAVVPDGHQAISASADGTLKVWDLERGAELRTLAGHTEEVTAVAVTADGRRVISASEDRTLRVWDLESGVQLRTVAGHTENVPALVVMADGRGAISASADGTLKVWDLERGAELRTLAGHTEEVTAVAVTPDGRRAVSASWDGTLKVWDPEQGVELRTLVGHNRGVKTVAVTPDGRRAVSASLDDTLKVWDLESGAELHTLRGHSEPILAAAVTPDGQQAISTSWDCTLKVWGLVDGGGQSTFLSERVLSGCTAAPDGVTIVAGDGGGRVHMLRLENLMPGPPALAVDASDPEYEAMLHCGLEACRKAGDDRGVVGHLGALIALLERAGRSGEAVELRLEYDGPAAQLAVDNEKASIAARGERTREEAQDCCDAEDYAGAEAKLLRLLWAGFDIPGTHERLARICLVTDRDTEAREHVSAAWEHRAEAASFGVPRTLWFRTAFALLEGASPSLYLARLKTALQAWGACAEWTMVPVLEHLRPRLSEDDHAFVTALVAALNDEADLPALEGFAAWREVQPQPLE